MYLEYYSLERPPFKITPDPSLFYTGGANGRGVVLEALLYAISSGEGILKVVGEVGSGKTMLCRMLEERLPESVEIVYLANPNLSPHDILYAIAFELKLPVDHSTQRLVLMQHLQEYLLQQHAANKSVLVIIEEAQSMPLETLEEVRLFSNLETHQNKLMQIVLFGQPELDKNLQDKSIRQLRERITHSFNLRPLNPEEVSDYIRFRLQAAGCPAPQVFSDAAEKLIARASGGLTRRINILADKAMLSAYAESATGQRPRMIDHMLQPVVLPQHVWAAIKDSGYKPAFMTTPYLAAGAAAIALVVLGLIWWTVSLLRTPDPSAEQAISTAQVSMSSREAGLPAAFQAVTKGDYALLDARTEAMGRWLSGVGPDNFTVRLLSVPRSESAYANRVLEQLSQAGLLARVYSCLENRQGEDYWKVVYGDFSTVEEARLVINGLPSQFRTTGPVVQNIRSLRCAGADGIM